MVPSAGQLGVRKGVWEPLPLILYGYAIHPLTTETTHRITTRASIRTRASSFTQQSDRSELLNRDVVPLEVGDEIYAFEIYTPRGKETEGVWYRGYVVCSSRRPPVKWVSSDPSSSTAPKYPLPVEEPQQVLIGIFPASHIHTRDELPDTDGRIADLAKHLREGGDLYAWQRTQAEPPHEHVTGEVALNDANSDAPTISSRPFRLGPPPDQANSSRAGLPVNPVSLRSVSPSLSEVPVHKPLPPRPSLKSGDDTISGSEEPIVDEISSALREWYNLMFCYLARRDYRLFHTIREHIEALHMGRRQLLAQSLSMDEAMTCRQDCVARLVSGNIIQGLDVIVRHPTWGALVTFDVEDEVDMRTWVSTGQMYAMQVALAYMDLRADITGIRTPSLRPSMDFTPLTMQSSIAMSSMTLPSGRPRANSRAMGILSSASAQKQAPVRFFHVFLEMRAFVSSICAPGETAELFFSLYDLHDKDDGRFVTEEFCAVLNHNGVLYNDPTARIRTLFTDLATSDVLSSVYLICRIVRNGSWTMRSDMSSGVPTAVTGKRQQTPTSPTVQHSRSTTMNGTRNSHPISSKPSTASLDVPTSFRRPFGCAVLELSQLNRMPDDPMDASSLREYTMPIYAAATEELFSNIHQEIISGNTKAFEKSSRAEAIAISVKCFRGDAPTIVKENPSLLQDTPLTQRLGFPDVVFPGETRNEVYVKLWAGEFASAPGGMRLSVALPGAQSAPSNVQVTVEVRTQDGRTVERSVMHGSGEPAMTQFHSMVFRRNNSPTFGELFKIPLPSNGKPDWHLFFTFRHRSTRESQKFGGSISRPGMDANDRLFAFGYLPLFPTNYAFLQDGAHNLVLYKVEKATSIPPKDYLGAPSVVGIGQRPDMLQIHPDLQRTAVPLLYSMIIRTSLCSTKYTQNDVLLKLLNWEEDHDVVSLSKTLSEFKYVGELEVVKFLRDIFDSLFSMLVSPINQNGELDSLVFQALVTVLGIVQDRRFNNFQPVLDIYVEQHFNCASAASHMIHSMNVLLSNAENAEGAPNLQNLNNTMKVWHHVFKFITRARELQKVKELGMGSGATAEHLETTFKREVRAHLEEVNRLMSTTTPPSIIGTQIFALQHLNSVLPELAKLFNTPELVSITKNFANAIASRKGKLVIWKLIMYLHVVKGFLFDIPEARSQLVKAVIMWIKPHFGLFDEYAQSHQDDSEAAREASRINWLESIRLCATIIVVMLDKLQQAIIDPKIKGNAALLRDEMESIEDLLTLLPCLLDSYQEVFSAGSRKVLDRMQTLATVPVAFPETYPFSLIARRPQLFSPQKASQESSKIFNCILAETAIALLSLLLTAPRKQLYELLETILDIEGQERFSSLMQQIFEVFKSIMDSDALPANWLNVNILTHRVVAKLVDPAILLLEKVVVPRASETFNMDTWQQCFLTLLRLLSSDQLTIEEFSPQKRRAVWRLAGDIRGDGASLMLRLWDALGTVDQASQQDGDESKHSTHQHTLSGLVGHVVNLCLSHHDQLRNNAVYVLYSMIINEYTTSQSFDLIETELIHKLDTLFMSDSKGDDISRAFFVGQLRHLFDSAHVDDQLRQRVRSFLDSVDLFLELLLQVRALPDGEEFQDDRVIATLRLMNFIRRIGRDKIYIKYVHQLVNMHLHSQNYVEAALTLKLHADLHEWDTSTFVEPMEDLGLPKQSQFARKETLCLLILDYLGKGKAWETAIEICKELAFQHAEVTFNYLRLSEILMHEATLLEHIVTEQRYYADYFRVAFYGSFPEALRNKQFIYRGYEWERFGAFCERMLNKHPGAQLLRSMSEPAVDIRFGTDQYIQCTAVSTEPNRALPIFTNPDVPAPVRTYYEHCGINVFSCQRSIPRDGRDGTEELWTEKTFFTTEETFPTVLRRSEIIDIQPVLISPIQNALNEVEQKTKELSGIFSKYSTMARTGQALSTNALSMSLNSAVDTGINGGITLYRQTFLTTDYAARNPEQVDLVEKLWTALDKQVGMIDQCLKLHGNLCPQEMLPFHTTLDNLFRKNFAEEIRRLPADGPSEFLPPSPSLYSNRRDLDFNKQRPESYASSSDGRTFMISSLYGDRSIASPPQSPYSGRFDMPPKQSLLQKNLAHLARHGMGGVSSTPENRGAIESQVGESSSGSHVNVGSPPAVQAPASVRSAATVGGGSLKGRFSRLGSLNFGRRD